MSEGLRPHRHCYFEVESKRYFDKNRGCAIRKTHYECMICGHEFYETVELMTAYHALIVRFSA